MAGKNGKRKILLVDDDPLIQHLRAEILRKVGYAVEPANTLEEARKRWRPNTYSLIVVDFRRDVQRGMEFCEEIKQRFSRQLVAFLTPQTAYIPRNSCPDDVIPKEEGPEEFVQRVHALMAAA